MLNGPVSLIQLSQDELDKYSVLLSNITNQACIATALYKVNQGANNAKHFAVETNTGEAYGFKAVTRVGKGCLRETLCADIALLLGAPNACLSFNVGLTFGVLVKTEVSVNKWLHTGRGLDKIAPDDIKASPINFFEQFGEWALLCAYVGISDRANGGNWVYDLSRELLTMVDLDDAFTVAPQLNFVPWAITQYADLNLFRNLTQTYPVRSAFARGVQRMHTKLVEKEQEIVVRIREAGLSYNSPQFCQETAETVIQKFINAA